MKKILSMFLVIVMCFAFVGCGGGEDANPERKTIMIAEKLKPLMASVTHGKLKDNGS